LIYNSVERNITNENMQQGFEPQEIMNLTKYTEG